MTDDGIALYDDMNNEFTDTVDEGELLELLTFLKTKKTKKFDSIKCDYGTKESLVDRVVWKGGSESSTFNRLEEIAMTNFPSTPVLKAEITRALDTRLIGRNYLTSRSCDRRSYITLLLLPLQDQLGGAELRRGLPPPPPGHRPLAVRGARGAGQVRHLHPR